MICYLDKTFCPYWRECARGEHCHRALTGKVKQAAELQGLPVSQFVGRPACLAPLTQESEKP